MTTSKAKRRFFKESKNRSKEEEKNNKGWLHFKINNPEERRVSVSAALESLGVFVWACVREREKNVCVQQRDKE